MNTISWISYEQVLDQGLHILGRIWRRGVVGRQLDERGQKVLAFLHVFLHFLPDTNTHVKKNKNKKPAEAFRTFQNQREPTCDTTVTLVMGVAAGGGAAVTVTGVVGTPAGLAVPPAVITEEVF